MAEPAGSMQQMAENPAEAALSSPGGVLGPQWCTHRKLSALNGYDAKSCDI
jgi:hypothetical protein